MLLKIVVLRFASLRNDTGIMFSGIIKKTIKPISVKKSSESMKVVFPIPKGWELSIGESVNIDGVCSTVESLKENEFGVYFMPETLSKTTFSELSDSHVFNLERSLTLNDLIAGHLVYGHVDTTAEVKRVEEIEESRIITFELPKEFTKYIVYKGSIAVNGVSLTVVKVDDTSFSVSLIPHTLSETNLSSLQKGDRVNIEVDMIAKHIEKLLKG